MDKDNRQDNQIIVLENNYLHMTKQIDALEKAVKEGFTDLKSEFKCMRDESDSKYVTNERFLPIRMIVYGMVGAVLLYALTQILELT